MSPLGFGSSQCRQRAAYTLTALGLAFLAPAALAQSNADTTPTSPAPSTAPTAPPVPTTYAPPPVPSPSPSTVPTTYAPASTAAPPPSSAPAPTDAPAAANAAAPTYTPVPAPTFSPAFAPPPGAGRSDSFGSSSAPTYDSSPRSFSHGLQFVYLNLETGYQKVGLRTLHTSNFLPETVDTSGSGAFFGVGAGVQLAFFTLGPRFRTASLDTWDLWSLDLEASFRIPLGRVEPYFIFAAGYAKLDSAVTGATGLPEVSVRGFNGRMGLGLDVFATKNITLGASATGELLALSRSGENLTASPQGAAAACNAIVDPVQKQQCLADVVYASDGSSIGLAGTISFVAGLHF